MLLKRELGVCFSLCLLFGCSSSVQVREDTGASYEEYVQIIEQLDQVKSYHVSTQSYDHMYAEDYQYMEEAEADVQVGEEEDTATGNIQLYFVYEDGTKEDVICSSTELTGVDETNGCTLVHPFQNATLIYSDGYETSVETRMSAHYFMIMPNMEDAVYTKNGDTWTIQGASDAENEYIATLTVDEDGYPSQFTYAYDSLGISLTRTISELQK